MGPLPPQNLKLVIGPKFSGLSITLRTIDSKITEAESMAHMGSSGNIAPKGN